MLRCGAAGRRRLAKQASAASAIGGVAGEIGWAGAEGGEVVFGGERALQVGGEDGGVDVEDVSARAVVRLELVAFGVPARVARR